jgi:hypothetical protein
MTFPAANAGPHAAQTVVLDKGWTDAWQPTPRRVTVGTLVALNVPAAWARPTDARQPVLMVDDRALPIVWTSSSARCLIGLIPDQRDSGRFAWTSGDRLPEQIDAETGRRFAAAAQAAGVPRHAIRATTPTWTAVDDRSFDSMIEAFAAVHCAGR